MTVFTDFVGYNRMSYNDTFRSSPLFVTYGTQFYDFIRTSNVPQSQLALRVNQLLGLPDSAANGRVNDRVVEVVAPTQSIIRPERDPSVTNPTSSVAFPAGTSQTYQTFFYNTLVDSKYVLPPGNVPFPFTQLGYTYDWNNPANIHGLAEFVILSPKSPNPVNGASVTGITQVNSVVSLLSYRYYDHQGNFRHPRRRRHGVGGNSLRAAGGVRHGRSRRDGLPRHYRFIQRLHDHQRRFHSRARKKLRPHAPRRGGAVRTRRDRGEPWHDSRRNRHLRLRFVERSDRDLQLRHHRGEAFGHPNRRRRRLGDACRRRGGRRHRRRRRNQYAHVRPRRGQLVLLQLRHSQLPERARAQRRRALDGSVSGNLDLYAGAALSGNAAVQGNLTNNGVLNPGDGNGSGNIQVAGNYVQTAGSTLEIQVAKPLGGVRESNYLNVGGTATFAAGSTIEVGHVAAGQDVFRGGDQFPILFTALPSTNIVDQGVNIVTHSAFLRFTPTIVTQSLGYPGNLAAYTLQVSRFAPFTSAAVGANHLSMAAALDLDGNLATGTPAGVVNELLFMDPAQFNAALDPLSPADYIAAATATLRNTQYQGQAIGNRLRSLRPAMMCFLQSARCCKTDSCSSDEECDCPPRKDGLNAFVTPTGLFFSQDPRGERVGFQANSAGVLAGADRWLSSEFLAGMAFAYDHDFLSFRGQGGNGNVNSYRVGPYAAWFRDDWFASAWMAYGYDSNIIRRAVPVGALSLTPQGRYSNNGGTVYLEGGRDFRRGKLLITPFGSLQYIDLSQGNFTETSGGGSDLRVYAASFNSLRSRMLLQLSRSYAGRRLALTPGLFGGWVHEYLANDPIRAIRVGVDRFSHLPGGDHSRHGADSAPICSACSTSGRCSTCDTWEN